MKKNKIREGITKYFKDRSCYALIRPLNDENELAHIEEQQYSSLKEEFQDQMNRLVDKIHAKSKAKIIDGKTLNISMFFALAIEYVEAMNNDTTPTISTALDRVVSAESNQIMDRIDEDIREEVDRRADIAKFPMEKEDLEEIMSRIKHQYIERIHRELSPILGVDDIVSNQSNFLDKFQYLDEMKYNENYTESFLLNSSILQELIKNVPINIQNVEDKEEGRDSATHENNDHYSFCKSLFNVMEEYQRNCKGPAKFDTLAEFIIESNFVDELKLVNDDKKLDFRNGKKYFSYILAFTQNFMNSYYKPKQEKAKDMLIEAQATDRELKTKKNKYEEKLEKVQREIEISRSKKSEIELRIDQYERQKHTMDAEFDNEFKMKEMELAYKIKTKESELIETENLLKQLKSEQSKIKMTNEELK